MVLMSTSVACVYNGNSNLIIHARPHSDAVHLQDTSSMWFPDSTLCWQHDPRMLSLTIRMLCLLWLSSSPLIGREAVHHVCGSSPPGQKPLGNTLRRRHRRDGHGGGQILPGVRRPAAFQRGRDKPEHAAATWQRVLEVRSRVSQNCVSVRRLVMARVQRQDNSWCYCHISGWNKRACNFVFSLVNSPLTIDRASLSRRFTVLASPFYLTFVWYLACTPMCSGCLAIFSASCYSPM